MNTLWICLICGVGFILVNGIEDSIRCRNKASVVFLVPMSQNRSSLAVYLEDIILEVVNYFEISENYFKISVMEYNDIYQLQSKFHTNRKLANSEISTIGYKRIETELSGIFLKPILERAFLSIDNLFDRVRKHIIVLFLNQNILDPQDSNDFANYTKQNGVLFYVVTSFTGSLDTALSLASDPCKAFIVDDYKTGMDAIISDLGNNICLASRYDESIAVTSGPDTLGNCNLGSIFNPPDTEIHFHCYDVGLFPDLLNCAYYYKCNKRHSHAAHLKCVAGNMFDANTQVCNHKEAVSCYTGVSCPEDTGLFPFPGNCNKFLNCFQGLPYVQSCPGRLVFDRIVKRCLLSIHAMC